MICKFYAGTTTSRINTAHPAGFKLLSVYDLHDKFPDEQTELLALLEGLLVRVVGCGDEEVVDLVLAVRQADLGLVLDDVLDLVELAHPVEDVVRTGQLFALAHRVALVSCGTSLVVKPVERKKVRVRETQLNERKTQLSALTLRAFSGMSR